MGLNQSPLMVDPRWYPLWPQALPLIRLITSAHGRTIGDHIGCELHIFHLASKRSTFMYTYLYIYILYAEVLQYCDVLYCSTIYLKLFVFLLIQSNSYDIAVASMYVARLSPSEETARSLGKSMNIINKMVILLITGPRHLKSGSNIPIKLQTFTSCPQS